MTLGFGILSYPTWSMFFKGSSLSLSLDFLVSGKCSLAIIKAAGAEINEALMMCLGLA